MPPRFLLVVSAAAALDSKVSPSVDVYSDLTAEIQMLQRSWHRM